MKKKSSNHLQRFLLRRKFGVLGLIVVAAMCGQTIQATALDLEGDTLVGSGSVTANYKTFTNVTISPDGAITAKVVNPVAEVGPEDPGYDDYLAYLAYLASVEEDP
ncbi:MAG: hypothetical protein LBQ96_02265, partial [Fusobacteriaceae bacterium]|nr:hypothetical protein [Fusobacteriaceae bacterium]